VPSGSGPLYTEPVCWFVPGGTGQEKQSPTYNVCQGPFWLGATSNMLAMFAVKVMPQLFVMVVVAW
jgi:hypothetical protein